MWKIFIEYNDKSNITLTGKHKDIPLELALKYNRLYANSIILGIHPFWKSTNFLA